MEEENGKGRDGQRRQPSCKRNGRGQRTRGVKRGREGNEKGGLMGGALVEKGHHRQGIRKNGKKKERNERLRG